ncbi:MAG: BatD [Ignavibacteria bacterium]|nr:MAG: BatD [Ignavibacteria bacterium]KAF0159847.1 MAG: BatD [Ignavibacteria bacterium]
MFRIMVKYFCAVIIFAVITNTLFAQKFSASIERTTIGLNDRFQVDFNFEGGDINNVSNFRPPTFSGFRILSGPNQSSSMQIINGRASGSLGFSYVLQPSSIGEFTIGSASIDLAGKTYSTQPIKIKVEKGSSQAQQQQNSGGYSQQELAKNVFIIAEANKTRALQGEQITVTYKLYTKLNIASPQITKLPAYEGFWSEEIGPIKQINFDLEMYRGERYRVAKIKQVALFPSKTGTLNVTPFELNVPVIVKKKRTGNDMFDEFFNDSFFGRSETVEFLAKSNTIRVVVEALPSGAPASFNGAVGNFNFKAEVDKNDVTANESITLRMNLNGSGNIKLLNPPTPQLPGGMEKYEPKTVENINRGTIVSGQKIIDYLLIPRSSGTKEIPAIEFTYFNPASRKYVTLKSPTFRINVRPGIGGEAASNNFAKEDVKLLSQDIRYIKLDDFNLEPKQEITFIKTWFWVSIILPLFAMIGAFVYKSKQEKLYGNVKLMKFQKAEKEARKRLKLAKAALDSQRTTSFYTEISLALFGYLEDKLSIQRSEFTLEGAAEILIKKNVNKALIDSVKKIAERCEFARFAPQGEMQAAANDMLEETVKVIVALDSSIGGKK